MIQWPAILKFSADDELAYYSSVEEWEKEIHGQHLHPDDILIDSKGLVFSITVDQDGDIQVEPNEKRLTLQEVLQIVRLHAAQDGACCVAKIGACTIEDAIKLIG